MGFIFNISPEAGILSILVFLIVLIWLFIKDAGRKDYQKKHSHDWTPKDWEEFLGDVQKDLDDHSGK